MTRAFATVTVTTVCYGDVLDGTYRTYSQTTNARVREMYTGNPQSYAQRGTEMRANDRGEGAEYLERKRGKTAREVTT